MYIQYLKTGILFFIIIFLLGCSKNPGSNIADNFIEKIAVIDDPIPSKYVQYNLYVRTDKALVLVTNVNFLNDLYKNFYQNNFKNFHSFLQALLKQEFKINAKIAVKYEYQTFTENPDIMNLSPKTIIGKYFHKNDRTQNYYFYPKTLSTNDTQTILYKMFLEGYLISFDDYGGKYNITKYKDSYP